MDAAGRTTGVNGAGIAVVAIDRDIQAAVWTAGVNGAGIAVIAIYRDIQAAVRAAGVNSAGIAVIAIDRDIHAAIRRACVFGTGIAVIARIAASPLCRLRVIGGLDNRCRIKRRMFQHRDRVEYKASWREPIMMAEARDIACHRRMSKTVYPLMRRRRCYQHSQ
jgi:hypothetical protein